MTRIEFSAAGEIGAGYKDALEFFRDRGVSDANAALRSLPWPFRDGEVQAVRICADPSLNLSRREYCALFKELYRVCADGAPVEITETGGATDRAGAGEACARSMFTLSVTDLDERQRGADVTDLECDFILCHYDVSLSDAFTQGHRGEFVDNEVLKKYHAEDPTVISRISVILAARKDHRYTAAAARVQTLPHFVMDLYEPGDNNMFCSRNILFNGIHEAGETYLFMLAMRGIAAQRKEQGRKSRLLNPGANLGWYSIVGALCADNVIVDAFEPTPETLTLLNRNVVINALEDRITVVDQGLSDSVGTCEFFINPLNAGSNSMCAYTELEGAPERFDKISVKITTLDEYYKDTPTEELPDLMLIDVEGHERHVFDGAEKLFERGFRPLIFAEFTPFFMKERGGDTYHRKLCMRYGYTPYQIVNEKEGSIAKLLPCDCASLDQAYEELRNDKCGSMLNIMFAPESFDLPRCRFKD